MKAIQYDHHPCCFGFGQIDQKCRQPDQNSFGKPFMLLFLTLLFNLCCLPTLVSEEKMEESFGRFSLEVNA